MNTSKLLQGIAVLALGLLTSCGGGGGSGGSVEPTATFQALEMPAGYTGVRDFTLSADGAAGAATLESAAGGTMAFRWSAAQGWRMLGLLPDGSRSSARALSADGAVIVGSGDTSAAPTTASVAYRWTEPGGMQIIAPLAGASICEAATVSADGAVLAGTCLASNNRGFAWTQAGGVVGFGQYGGGMGASSTATSIAPNGSVVGGAGNPFLSGAMLWSLPGATPEFLGKPGPQDLSATVTAILFGNAFDPRGLPALAALGAGTDANGNLAMFMWTQAGGMVKLGAAAVPMAGSANGTRIVGFGTPGGLETAIIWDSGIGSRTLTDALATEHALGLPGWRLVRANFVSGDGKVIAGIGMDPAGASRAWIVRLAR